MTFATRRRRRTGGWLREEALRELARLRLGGRGAKLKRIVGSVEKHPALSACVAQGLILGVSLLLSTFNGPIPSILAPERVDGALSTAWQVHSSFVAIAFAGLVMLIQSTSTELMISAESLRAALIRDAGLQFTLTFSLVGAIQLGIVATWISKEATLFVQLLGVVGFSMVLIVRAYWRANELLSNPGLAYGRAVAEMRKRMRESILNSRADILASQKLEAEVPKPWGWSSRESVHELVQLDGDVILSDVNLGLLQAVKAELASTAGSVLSSVESHEEALASDVSREVDRPQLGIVLNIGTRVRRPTYVFRIDPGSSTIDFNKVEARLMRAIKSVAAINSISVFEHELGMLRDSIVDAAIQGGQRKVQRGLEMLRIILREAPQMYSEVHAQEKDDDVVWIDRWYGPEWDELLRASMDVQAVARSVSNDSVRHQLLIRIFSFIVDALDRRNPTAALRLSDLLIWTWNEMAPLKGNWSESDSSYFLLRIGEVARMELHHASFDHRIADLITRVFVLCAKGSMDNGSITGCREILGIYEDVARSHDRKAIENEYRHRHDAALLVLLAWLLLKESGSSPGSDDGDARWLVDQFDSVDVLMLLEVAHDPEFARVLQWSWWEVPPLRGRAVAGSFEMSTYLDIAVLILLTRGQGYFPQEVTETTADAARRLFELLKRFDEGTLRLNVSINESHYIRDVLRHHIDDWSRKEALVLAESPLDVSKIELFYRKIQESLECKSDLTSVIAEEFAGNGEATFGYHRFEHKSFFVSGASTSSVEMMASSIVEAIDNGEGEEVVDIILDHDAIDICIDDLPRVAEAWLVAQGGGNLVLGTNSWVAYSTLKVDAVIGKAKAIVRTHFGSGFYVFAIQTPAGVCIQRKKVVPDTRVGTVLAGGRILAYVGPMDDDDVFNMQQRYPERGELEFRNQVRVKVLESVQVKVSDPSKVMVWRLPDDAY